MATKGARFGNSEKPNPRRNATPRRARSATATRSSRLPIMKPYARVGMGTLDGCGLEGGGLSINGSEVGLVRPFDAFAQPDLGFPAEVFEAGDVEEFAGGAVGFGGVVLRRSPW